MKNYIVIAIIFLLASTIVNAQTEEEQVKKIRKWFSTINTDLKDYTLVEKDVEDESTEGGFIKAYYNNDKLILMHCEFYGEMGNLVEDYYYNNEKLFFVFAIRNNYSSPVYEEVEKTISKEENRYYFNNDKMIRWIDAKSVKIVKSSDYFIKTGKSIFDESVRLLEVFETH